MDDKRRLLITVDSLFDTRLSLLNYFNYKIAYGYYLGRVGDNFKFLGEAFTELYKRRTDKLLYGSLPTKIIDVIRTMAIETVSEGSLESKKLHVELDINIYPYILDDDIIERIRLLTKSGLPNIEVFTIRQHPTKALLKKYIGVIDYSGLEMINNIMLSEGLELGEMINTKLIVPDCMNDPVVYKKTDVEEFLNGIMGLIGKFINLQFLSKVLFSINYNEKKEEPTDTD